MEHKTASLILLVGFVIPLLICVRLGLAQSPNPSPMPAEVSQLCLGMMRRSDEFDSMLYTLGGVGGALDPQRINWTLVESYLARDFIWQDYSPFPSHGNYTSAREFWPELNADQDVYPLVEVPVRMWRSCDPVTTRLVAQWRETYGRRANPIVRETSWSIYITEFDSAGLLITRQAWWTTSNMANVLIPASANKKT